MQQPHQLSLFPNEDYSELDSSLWHGSFNRRESTLQQLSPYVGKMKSGMARALLRLYTKPGDVVLDPFSGSGVVPLEAALTGRQPWANDLSPYAYAVTRGKLEAPATKSRAIELTQEFLTQVEQISPSMKLQSAPDWVQDFFHPDTLREILAAFQILREQESYFLMACMLGILHHVRPGFLSYPASHLVPYLRKKNIRLISIRACMLTEIWLHGYSQKSSAPIVVPIFRLRGPQSVITSGKPTQWNCQ